MLRDSDLWSMLRPHKPYITPLIDRQVRFSYLATIVKVNFLQYIIVTLLGTIPGTLAITIIGSRLKQSLMNDKMLGFNIFQDPIFIISIIFIFALVFLSKKIKSKYFNE